MALSLYTDVFHTRRTYRIIHKYNGTKLKKLFIHTYLMPIPRRRGRISTLAWCDKTNFMIIIIVIITNDNGGKSLPAN